MKRAERYRRIMAARRDPGSQAAGLLARAALIRENIGVQKGARPDRVLGWSIITRPERVEIFRTHFYETIERVRNLPRVPLP